MNKLNIERLIAWLESEYDLEAIRRRLNQPDATEEEARALARHEHFAFHQSVHGHYFPYGLQGRAGGGTEADACWVPQSLVGHSLYLAGRLDRLANTPEAMDAAQAWLGLTLEQATRLFAQLPPVFVPRANARKVAFLERAAGMEGEAQEEAEALADQIDFARVTRAEAIHCLKTLLETGTVVWQDLSREAA